MQSNLKQDIIGILLNGVLRPTLLNNPFTFCPFINREFFYHI